jgi:cytochrome bd-type quinol oxidase subunit 1
MNRKLKIAGFVALLVTMGLFRESLFVHVNALLYYKRNGEGYPDYAIGSAYQWLDRFSYRTLYTSKWFITPIFAFLFWFVQKKFLLLIFNEKKTSRWLTMLYLSLLLLAGIAFAGGWIFDHLNEGYRFSRIFMGLLQSPVPCMLLIPLTYFYKHNQDKL